MYEIICHNRFRSHMKSTIQIVQKREIQKINSDNDSEWMTLKLPKTTAPKNKRR